MEVILFKPNTLERASIVRLLRTEVSHPADILVGKIETMHTELKS